MTVEVELDLPLDWKPDHEEVDHTWALVVVPLGLGLLGFIEPCTLGSSLLWLKYLEGKPPMMRRFETVSVAVTRSMFIGGLGALAALIGSRFLSYQRGFWVGLGVVYVIVGVMYLARMEWLFARSFGPRLTRGRARGAVALGLLFGLNIPACAAPLLAALMAASAGVANVGRGFLAMAVFGLALSLPLVLAVFWNQGRDQLDRLIAMSRRVPRWTGVVFVLLGMWSIYFGVKPFVGPVVTEHSSRMRTASATGSAGHRPAGFVGEQRRSQMSVSLTGVVHPMHLWHDSSPYRDTGCRLTRMTWHGADRDS